MIRCPSNLDPLVVYEGHETHYNLQESCSELFKSIVQLQL